MFYDDEFRYQTKAHNAMIKWFTVKRTYAKIVIRDAFYFPLKYLRKGFFFRKTSIRV